MNALTIREPYASLLMIGAKKIETRSWPAPAGAIGQTIAIHAAKGLTWEELRLIEIPEFRRAFIGYEDTIFEPGDAWRMAAPTIAFQRTRGKVIATATLSAVLKFTPFNVSRIIAQNCESVDELRFGDFSPGRYGWVLTNVRRLATPVPARGQQGLWQWEMPETAQYDRDGGTITGTAQKLEATALPLTVRLSHQEEANA